MHNKLIRRLIFLTVVGMVFIACNKNSATVPVMPANKISGRWRIDSLVSIFRDSIGNINDTQLYPKQPGVDFYFEFNNDGTWNETATFSSTTPGDLTASSGSYVLKSDSTFDMIYTGAQTLSCKITKLTPTAFTFHRSYPTLFNGTMHGTIERIFTLKR